MDIDLIDIDLIFVRYKWTEAATRVHLFRTIGFQASTPNARRRIWGLLLKYKRILTKLDNIRMVYLLIWFLSHTLQRDYGSGTSEEEKRLRGGGVLKWRVWESKCRFNCNTIDCPLTWQQRELSDSGRWRNRSRFRLGLLHPLQF